MKRIFLCIISLRLLGYWSMFFLLAAAFTPWAAWADMASSQKIILPFKIGDLSYKDPGCLRRWNRSSVLTWLRRNDVWLPDRHLLPNPEDREFLKDALQGEEVFMWRGWKSDEGKPIPLQWLDIDGDGVCDFIGSWAAVGGRGANQTIYVFLQRESGFKLVDYSVGEYEYSGTGIAGGDLVTPIWLKGSKIPFLVGTPEAFVISGFQTGHSRWNAKRQRFDGFQIWPTPHSPLKNEAAKSDAVARLLEEFMEKNPPKFNETLSCKTFYENAPMCADPPHEALQSDK